MGRRPQEKTDEVGSEAHADDAENCGGAHRSCPDSVVAPRGVVVRVADASLVAESDAEASSGWNCVVPGRDDIG